MELVSKHTQRRRIRIAERHACPSPLPMIDLLLVFMMSTFRVGGDHRSAGLVHAERTLRTSLVTFAAADADLLPLLP
eukprot:595320-Amphidinium_carterae.2